MSGFWSTIKDQTLDRSQKFCAQHLGGFPKLTSAQGRILERYQDAYSEAFMELTRAEIQLKPAYPMSVHLKNPLPFINQTARGAYRKIDEVAINDLDRALDPAYRTTPGRMLTLLHPEEQAKKDFELLKCTVGQMPGSTRSVSVMKQIIDAANAYLGEQMSARRYLQTTKKLVTDALRADASLEGITARELSFDLERVMDAVEHVPQMFKTLSEDYAQSRVNASRLTSTNSMMR